MNDIRGLVDCTFYVRTYDEFSGYKHERISINSPHVNGGMRTDSPPLVGDHVSLYDFLKKTGGVFKVIQRQWMHSSYGSVNWPVTEQRSKVPPSLSVIVVEAPGHVMDDYAEGME